MKRATGSNRAPQPLKRVSVQLTLDGHFFSEPAPETLLGVEEVELLTAATLLVPHALFDPSTVGALFAAAGMPLAEGMRTVVATSPAAETGADRTIAVMALAGAALRTLEARCGSQVRYTTPLLQPIEVSEPTVWLCDTGRVLYLRVFDPAPQLAEAVPAETEEERAYLVERLCERIDAERYVLRLDDRTGCARRFCHRFKKTIPCA